MNRKHLLGPAMSLALAACTTSTSQSAQAPAPQPAPVAAPAPAPKAPTPGIDASILDRAVDPCNDFYQYACGGWLQKTEIPADRPTWSRGFSEIQDKNLQQLKDILEGYAAGQKLDEIPEAKKLGDYYASCMDEAKVDAQGVAPLQPELARLKNIKNAATLEQAVAHLQDVGVSAMFNMGSEQDAKDATQVIAAFTQGGMGLPDRDYYLKDDERSQKLREAYVAHVAKMLELSGLKPDAAAKGAQTVMRIEKSLAEAALTRVDRRDPNKVYHRLNLDGLVKTAPHFHWAALLADLGHADVKAINVAEPAFFTKLDGLVQKTPAADWQTYLRWHLVRSAAPALSKEFVEENFNFYGKTLTGTQQNLPRWKRCVGTVDRGMGFALAKAYVARTFGPDGKTRSQALVKEIEQQFGQNLASLSWMDEATRGRAREKLAAIDNKIGYPDKWRDYSSLSTGRDSFLQNVLAAREWNNQYDLNKIGKPLDRTEWDMTPPTVNAYYNPSMNEMVFPAGILQPPFFNRQAEEPVNYGGIGMVVGHELTHGFDDEGRQFDAQGNLKDWWTPESGKAFTQRAQCVINQYSSYAPLPDVHLNGQLTLGENLADLGGMKFAYRAMKAREAQQPSPPSEFTPEQAFFLGQAQSWCQKSREQFQRMLVVTDPHSPARFRVIGPISNMPEFAQAFHCPANAPMVRSQEQRCEVW